ncbi:MAG: caspase family protein [Bacteroidota bacterium]
MSDKKKKPGEGSTTSSGDGAIRPGEGDIYAFLVGINKYRQAKDLKGCVQDVEKIKTYLTDHFNVNEDDPIGSQAITADLQALEFNIPIQGYRSLKLLRVEDEKATYNNIVTCFQSFLTQANLNDRVWFHFSGHGAEAPTATEFFNLENGKDQTLLCHDYETDENTGSFSNLLADKELALLLNLVTSGEGGAPHIVVTLDCCHSGGSTRGGEDVRSEELPESAFESNRSLDSYLMNKDFNFTRQMERSNSEQPMIPSSPHVVLTACTNLELAAELKEQGGVFTNALIESLELVDGKISYSELLIRVRTLVSRRSRRVRNIKQTPQIDALGGEKAYTRFLEGTPFGDPNRYEVKRRAKHDTWTIECGAIQGLPTSADRMEKATADKEPVTIEIFGFEPVGKEGKDAKKIQKLDNEAVATATIDRVGPHYSMINLVSGSLEEEENKSYLGVLNYFPAEQETVRLVVRRDARAGFSKKVEEELSNEEKEGLSARRLKRLVSRKTTALIEKAKEDFIEAWNQNRQIGEKNIHIITRREQGIRHRLEVEITHNGYNIVDLDARKLKKLNDSRNESNAEEADKPDYQLSEIEEVFIALVKMVNWRRLLALENPGSPLLDKISLAFNLVGRITLFGESFRGKTKTVKAIQGEGIRGELPFGSLFYHLLPEILLEGDLPPLHFYLLNLWSTYRISAVDKKRLETPLAEGQERTITYPKNNSHNFGIRENEDLDTMFYKLIVTTEEIDHLQLLQSGVLPSTRGESIDDLFSITSNFDDWCAITMKVRMKREPRS